MTIGGTRELRDRLGEREALEQLLREARSARSAVLVIRGEAGVGKSALLRHLTDQSEAFHVADISGVECEMELPFAGIHRLCAPMVDQLDGLPPPQQVALRVALGLVAGDAPDRFLVALGLLTLLAEVAESQPLLCVVDDAQWLDAASRQVLGFVARRLLAEPVAIVFAVREPSTVGEFAGLPEMLLGGLDDEDARSLLATVIPGGLDAHIRDRIVAEARGNPLALLELPRGLSVAQLAGGFGLHEQRSLDARIEERFLSHLDDLPHETRLLLLVAAAEPVGDPHVMWHAATQLGVAATALEPATRSGLLDIGAKVRFRHPLVRSAVYRSATDVERRRVHDALADATRADVDPDRRAWHRAQATSDPDEDVAAELERSAGRAQMRGGLASSAAFLARAAALTPDPAHRARRALGAAGSTLQSGAPEAALALVAEAEAGPLDELGRALVHLLRGQAAFGSSQGRDAPLLLLAAARELEPLDPALARDTYLDALSAALFVGRLGGDLDLAAVAKAAGAAPPHGARRPQDLLLDGLAVTIADGYAIGAPVLKRAVRAFRAEEMPAADAIRWLWLATHAAHDLWDDESWELLCERHLGLAREAGALTVLPLALAARIGLHLFAGELTKAASLVEESAAVVAATGTGLPDYGSLALAAFRGREAQATSMIQAAREQLGPRGEGMGLTLVEHAAAVLYNGLGRYEEACDAAQRGAAHPQELAFAAWSLPQLVEAAARTAQPALAQDAVDRLEEVTTPSGTDWALGMQARCRALVSEGPAAESLYLEAADLLGRTRMRAELARTRLLFGEWLRRKGRRVDAREQLRPAHEMFTDMGMEAFGQRARRELAATGETVRKRGAETRDELTPQEEQIALLARDGRTNPEIGAELFLSPRTVEWHLHKVFAKLGIASRRYLADALPERAVV